MLWDSVHPQTIMTNRTRKLLTRRQRADWARLWAPPSWMHRKKLCLWLYLK